MSSEADSVPVRGVLFDLGGTLYSYESRDKMGQAATTTLERLGLDPSAPEVRAARSEAYEAVAREYASQASFLHKDLFRDRVARTASLLGVHASTDGLEAGVAADYTVTGLTELVAIVDSLRA
jgi:FMN phosphatase YigB (HAD superfamily)